VDLAPPPLDAAPAADPPPAPSAPPAGPPDRIIGGVAALLAARLDVDVLWVRIAFVLLALIGGIGLLLYAALWLTLVEGRRRPWARIAGGALLVVGVPLLLTAGGDYRVATGTIAVLTLLAGIAIALWQPRRTTPAPTAMTVSPTAAVPVTDLPTAPLPRRAPRPRRPPSILGRLALGVAVLTAAVGAFIDQANGGRLHPEQWLGASAIVCGLGLLAGAVVGHARWLVLPALLFAGAGFVAGEAARVGIHPDYVFGTKQLWVGADTVPTTHLKEHVLVGDVELDVYSRPSRPVTVDLGTAIGTVQIHVADDTTVEVRTRRADDVRVAGVRHAAGTFAVGPEGPPDVIVVVRVGQGHVDVVPYLRARFEPPTPPVPTTPPFPVGPTIPGG
jgi:phage shock protein PspC (stress-responsive transcriptional regulator)